MAVTTRNIVRLEGLERRPIRDGMGHVEGDHWEVFTRAAGGTEALRLLVQEYPPGGYTTDHPVHADFEQTYYVMSGEMTLTLDGEQHVVPAGTFVFIPRGARHGHRNDSNEPMMFMTINVPVRDGVAPLLPGGSK